MMKQHISYVNNTDMMFGMLSKNYKLLYNHQNLPIGFVKNRKQVVILNHADIISNIEYLSQYEKVNCGYLSAVDVDRYKNYCKKNNLNYKNSYKITSMISGPFTKDNIFYKKETKETFNKFDKFINIKTYNDINDKEKLNNDFVELIGIWDKVRGKEKYGWQNHSGYDKNFILNYFPKRCNDFYSNFFYNEYNKLIGYSFVSVKPVEVSENTIMYYYLLRKFINNFDKSRNIGLYIDYKTIQRLIDVSDREILLHWGGSSGGVLNYKITKFPMYSSERYYSGVITKND